MSDEPDLVTRVQTAVMMADIDVTAATRPPATDEQYRQIAEKLVRSVVGPERLMAAVLGAEVPEPRKRTPPERLPNGSTRITVQRCCSRCGEELGDATDEELNAAVAGVQLPDTGDEHGCTPQPLASTARMEPTTGTVPTAERYSMYEGDPYPMTDAEREKWRSE